MNTLQRKDAKTQGRKAIAPSVSLSLCASVLIILLAAALRFHNLSAQSLWNDEGNAYVQATRNFADIASNAARDIHPPGYYWLLAVWHDLAGSSEVALRAFSTLASILSVAFTFAIGKRLFNPVAGLAAAMLVALNTFSIYYAQEARMYALLALWASAGMWALVQLVASYKSQARGLPKAYLHSSRFRWGLVLALINAAGLYTQYAYPFIMLAQGVIFLLWLIFNFTFRAQRATPLQDITGGINPAPTLGTRYSILINYVASNLLTILLFLPWLPTALRQVTQWPSTGTPIPAAEALGIIGGWFTLGVTYEFVPNAVNYLPFALLI
nr:glycosyltransferase family 39 protein [Anaerolineae bacterium]